MPRRELTPRREIQFYPTDTFVDKNLTPRNPTSHFLHALLNFGRWNDTGKSPPTSSPQTVSLFARCIPDRSRARFKPGGNVTSLLRRSGQVLFIDLHFLGQFLLSKLIPDSGQRPGTVVKLVENGSDRFRERHACGFVAFGI
jgi:hypothetical protein